MKGRSVPIIGAGGNVGKGIAAAFNKGGWKVLSVDPKINNSLEELSEKKFNVIFSSASMVTYVAESGNRDEYAENPNLGKENNRRFADFCRKVEKINPEITIWYIGGSWTKRKPDKNWIVNDNSPNKSLKECNAYEKAKISAEENARKMSKLVKTRFVDWASIVPNLAPNFSISRMIAQALDEDKIRYSPGAYGRPLIESVQAGEALLVLIENDNVGQQFTKYLIPGAFVSFTSFAKMAKEVVEKETDTKIILEEMKDTPDFLRSQSKSEYFKKLDFVVDEKRLIAALDANAKEAFNKLK